MNWYDNYEPLFSWTPNYGPSVSTYYIPPITTPLTSLCTCPYCSGPHMSLACPRIKSIEYWENGLIKKVEFKSNEEMK